MTPEVRNNLLAIARRIVDGHCNDGIYGLDLAQEVIAALDAPSATKRTWKAGEVCPIVAEGQKRIYFGMPDYPYEVLRRSDNARHRVKWSGGRGAWLDADIARDPLTEDWTET